MDNYFYQYYYFYSLLLLFPILLLLLQRGGGQWWARGPRGLLSVWGTLMVDVNAAFSPLPQKLHPTSVLCVHQQWWPMFETYLDLVSNLTESHNCQSFDRWVWSSAAKRATLIAITHHEHRLPHQIWWRRRDRKRTPVSVLSLPGLCLFYPLSDRLVVSIWPEWLSIPINHGTPLHQNHQQQHIKKWP